jgi:radical SAM superfamily enzyme YgiQ (UPF0313 family)
VHSRGEGEQTIPEFCERVRKSLPTNDIRGTQVKDEDGNVVRNPPRPLANINDIIPDFSLFDERRFLRPLGAKIWKAMPIETYRGCPYQCAFCNSPAQVVIAREKKQGIYTRRKSMETLRRELSAMVERYNPNFLYINDDAFMADPSANSPNLQKCIKSLNFHFGVRLGLKMLMKISWLGLPMWVCIVCLLVLNTAMKSSAEEEVAPPNQ